MDYLQFMLFRLFNLIVMNSLDGYYIYGAWWAFWNVSGHFGIRKWMFFHNSPNNCPLSIEFFRRIVWKPSQILSVTEVNECKLYGIFIWSSDVQEKGLTTFESVHFVSCLTELINNKKHAATLLPVKPLWSQLDLVFTETLDCRSIKLCKWS